jgi:hypothetical protein
VEGVVVAAGLYLTTLPAQIAEAHVPATVTTTAQEQPRVMQVVDLNVAPESPLAVVADGGAEGITGLVVTVIVIALPVLAILAAIVVSGLIRRRKARRRPTRRPGQTY